MQQVQHYIEHLDTFKDLSSRERETLSIVLTPHKVRGGDYLFRQGDKANTFYVVASGRLMTIKELRAGLVEKVNELNPGDMIGLLYMLVRCDRINSVRAIDDSVVLSCTRQDFDRLFESQSVFSYKVIDTFVTTMSHNLREANDLVTSIFSDPKRTLLKLNQALITASKRLTDFSS